MLPYHFSGTKVLCLLAFAVAGYGADMSVFTWGYSGWGNLGNGAGGSGNGEKNFISTPTNIGRQASQVEAGSDSCYAITANHELFTWGANAKGQLGIGSIEPNPTPQMVTFSNGAGVVEWLAVSCKTIRVVALAQEKPPRDNIKYILTWGAGVSGADDQLSPIRLSFTSTPGDPSTDLEGAQLACGTSHFFVLTQGGALWGWGDNQFGQLGDGTNDNKTSVTSLAAPPDGGHWSAVACGLHYTMALSSTGNLYGWGMNDHRGQLGIGVENANSNVPVLIDVGGTGGVAAVACGFDHTLAVKLDGTLFTWGSNTEGQLGDGSNTNRLSPAMINLSGWTAVTCGDRTSLGLRGTTWHSWGSNCLGQLGAGDEDSQNAPRAIAFTGSVARAGGNQVIALR